MLSKVENLQVKENYPLHITRCQQIQKFTKLFLFLLKFLQKVEFYKTINYLTSSFSFDEVLRSFLKVSL